MIVGAFGEVIFRTSSFDITTFKNLSRKHSYKFAEHEVIKGKPYLQFIGENLEQISLDIVLDKGFIALYKDCRECRNMLLAMAKTGNAHSFVIGTTYLGEYVLESIDEKDRQILGNCITRMDLILNLKEYH